MKGSQNSGRMERTAGLQSTEDNEFKNDAFLLHFVANYMISFFLLLVHVAAGLHHGHSVQATP
jgi:hypothetical protein